MDKKTKRDWSKYRGRNNGSTTKISVRIPNDVHELLTEIAEIRKCSLSDLIKAASGKMANTYTSSKMANTYRG